MSRTQLKTIAIGAAAIVLILFLALGAFPWGVFKGTIEKKLSKDAGVPVEIASMKRRGAWSLTPTVILEGVSAPQAAWAGDGELVSIERAALRFAALPALFGNPSVSAAEIDGMRLSLVRDKDGRESWSAAPPDDTVNDEAAARPTLRTLIITNSTVAYDDAVQRRRLSADIKSDAAGFILTGDGEIQGEPVAVTARGAPVVRSAFGKAWPFRAEISGDAVGMTFEGEMQGPLDTGRLTAAATAHAQNLTLIDAIIEAGLLETQPVTLSGNVRRDSPNWEVTDLVGTIGRSDIAGHATIVKSNKRTTINGALNAKKFDFDDLSDAEGRRIAAEKRARFGDRLFPDTLIELDDVDDTDGELTINVDELLWPGPSPFRTLKGVLKVDHQLLTIKPLEVGLTHGVMSGSAIVDGRGDAPKLDLNLTASDARFADFFPGGGIDGDLTARMSLAGPGDTVRAAIGESSGMVALVTRDGAIPAKAAALLGQDVGGGVTAGNKPVALNCIIARFDVAKGDAKAGPFVIDTARSVTHAEGSIDFASERLSLTLNGAPKKDSMLRFDGAAPLRGTIKSPHISLPEDADSVGEILEMIGEAIIDEDAPIAQSVDCEALAATALK